MNRILVARGGSLGDTILTLPLLGAIRTMRPDSQVLFLGSRTYKSLIPPEVSFEALDGPEWLWLFSETISAPPDTANAFDEAYVILNQPETVVANLRRAGVKTVRPTSSKPRKGRHVVESICRGLGMAIPPRAPVLSRLAQAGTRDLIWLHPGSGGPGKCVPLDVIASLAETLRASTGWDMAVTAGEADSFLMARPGWERLIAVPRTRLYLNRSLEEICRELGGARLFVGNDSGISHLAAGLGVPSIVFFVSTDPAQWAPWVTADTLKVVDFRAGERDPGAIALECLRTIERFAPDLPPAAGSI